MKKNMLAVLILVLTLVNLSLTAFSVFIVVPNAKRVDNLITNVLSAIDLELESPLPSENATDAYEMKNTETFEINEMRANLKIGADGKMRFAAINCSLTIDKKHDDYSDLQPLLESYKTNISAIVQNKCSQLTPEDMLDVTIKSNLQVEILEEIQALFNSKFIVDFVMNVLTQTQ